MSASLRSVLVIGLASLAATCLLVALAPSAEPEINEDVRSWKAASGHQVEARMIGSADGKVQLETKDGRKIEVAIDVLSKGDQVYVAAVMRRFEREKKSAAGAAPRPRAAAEPEKKDAEKKPALGAPPDDDKTAPPKPADSKAPEKPAGEKTEKPQPVASVNPAMPTHIQVGMIKVTTAIEPTEVHTFCLGPDGNVMVGCGGERMVFIPKMGPDGKRDYDVRTFSDSSQLRIFTPDGRPLGLWPLALTPKALNIDKDGVIYIGGGGKLAKYDRRGRLLKIAAPEFLAEEKKSIQSVDDDSPGAKLVAGMQRSKEEEEADSRAAFLARKQAQVAGIAVSDQDLFVAIRSRAGFSVYRMDHDFEGLKKVVSGLAGCCGQMDLQTYNGELFAAENARKRVVRYDRDGKQLSAFGKTERSGVDGFGSCCNPMNLRFGTDGSLYTAESTLGRIKRYSAEGQLLGLAGVAKVELGCKHVPVDVSKDGNRVFVLNVGSREIAVLANPNASSKPGKRGLIRGGSKPPAAAPAPPT